MIHRITSTLLWDRALSPRLRSVWVALILLAPLALFAALYLHGRILADVPVRATIDRDQALAAVHAFAEQRGFDTAGWREIVRSSDEFEVYRYLWQQGQPGRDLLQRWSPWTEVLARLEDEQNEQSIELQMTPLGQQLGYRIRTAPPASTTPPPAAAAPTDTITDAAAAAIAARLLTARQAQFPEARFVDPSTGTGSVSTRVFKWKVRFAAIPELNAETTVRLRGDEVLEDSLHFTLSRQGKALAEVPGRDLHRGLYIAYLSVLGVLLIIRYVQRRIQKEASRQRMYLVALIVGGFIFSVVYLLDQSAVVTRTDGPVPFGVILGLMGFLLGCVGLFVGMVYSAAESELRETFPDRLVSLDAVLSGRLLSRNVGRSVLLGTVLLAWMLLVRNSIHLSFGSPFPGLDLVSGSHEYLMARTPWLIMLLASLGMGIFVALTTVMAPLAFLSHRIRRRRWLMPIIVLLAWFSFSFLTSSPLPVSTLVLAGLAEAAVLVGAFLAVDLVATLTVASGHTFLLYFLSLSYLAPFWQPHNQWAIGVALATVTIAAGCAFYGRAVRPDEVRPAYAREIQERLQLQSEVQAAREAQLRLLPAGPPKVAGIALAASCRPAEHVSGDFFDFFPIKAHKLGILISDGGANGLATALAIALTKGYLMQKSQSDLSPLETLRGLLAVLGAELHGINSEGLCYAVVDSEARTLSYARLGITPAVMVTASTDAARETLHRSDTGLSLWEGHLRLSPDARVIVYTNGLSRLIGEPDQESSNRWLSKHLSGLLTKEPNDLHDAILGALFPKRKGRKSPHLKDDITVLVLSIHKAQALEQVA
jgi:hypothetical protein